ncbi:4-hydroxythreonine-4-phosphate dehydrogenase PdxA [Solidesulfovibrio sp.]|uniref:4-hydroxythreonine-4-phosphate dehydrogenase PdxA n=1 Tax=Solidesulfovibrio sp. TaxID=2910990 RepID=UPI002B20BC90|nr:4-hydroxythreonine-4-phosphate dehydrogenase PdxA [Solidesulfovibrio sp.]MEA5090210.1 4-hydroxythreonine-4-phosphate dehydrogenase PdxA [Solidesulfovibrio sp.]
MNPTTTPSTPPLLLTLGDANGIGPELVCRLLSEEPQCRASLRLGLIGPEAALVAHCERLSLPRFWTPLPADNPDALAASPPGVYLLTPPRLAGLPVTPGKETPAGGLAAGESLEYATAVLARHPDWGIVTGPLSKAALNAAGFAFPGHTEFLAERSGVGPSGVCMHLCGPVLRVSLVTTHPPLARVPSLVTYDRVALCLALTWDYVKRLGLTDKPVAVCGLNPHAGEGGLLGSEDEAVLRPAVAAAVAKGIRAMGPLPADTVFHRAVGGEFSAILAMYHDQGLPPLKMLHFRETVNVTLGLPFVRTSVGHGTAFALVGTGEADTGSLRAALRLARRLTGGEGDA